jgi:cytochrome c
VLRNAKVDAHGFDEYQDVNKMAFGGSNLAIPAKSGAFVAIRQIDLNELTALQVMAVAPKPQLNATGGVVELHLGSPKGKLIGTSAFLEPSEKMDFTPNLVSVPINTTGIDTDKLQDVYAVFVNPKSESQSLMVVMGFQFKLVGDDAPATNQQTTTENVVEDLFAGKWNMTFIGTPQGDAVSTLSLTRKDGKLTGTVAPKMDGASEATIDKIEESPDKLTIYFKMMSYDLNVTLEKEDNDHLKGSLMGMFKVTAVKIN